MALPEIIKDIEARIIRPTSTDNAIVRFDGTTGQVQNSTPLIDDNGKITVPRMIHSNSVATSTDLSRIPLETEIAFETSSGNGADSVWLWRENWATSNYGIFHDNSADVIHAVGGGSSKFQINLNNGNAGVHGSLTVDGNAQVGGTAQIDDAVTAPLFNGELNGNAKTATTFQTTTLVSGDDINTLLSQKRWVNASTDICSSLLNKPSDMPAGEIAITITCLGSTTSWLSQEIKANGTAGYEEYVRYYANGTFKPWAKRLTSSNFNSYAPTLTGSGASGTWPISISGNAATATKAIQDENGAIISSTYLKLTGGTMKGNITMGGEYNFTGYIPRKNVNGGGWAYAPYRVIGADNEMFFNIGVYGGQDSLTYAYIGSGDYGASNNLKIYPSGTVWATAVQGAVWNDYAEFRNYKDSDKIPYGRVVIENGDDSLSLSTERLQLGGNICSDTFGFAIGETDNAKLPIAVSGRVLAYTNEPRDTYKPGEALCSGPNGTVSKMTREEIKEYPDAIIGYVSAVPDYEIWGTGNVKVDGRIWVKVK